MNKWEDLFEIRQERETKKRKDGSEFEVNHWFVYNKLTGQKDFSKARPYGYSDLTSAKSGAAHRFRQIIKVMEKELLGKEVR